MAQGTKPAAADAAPADNDPSPPAEPGWLAEIRELKQLVTDLPGKLRATVSDDDRRSIAEHVHGLFESSGAFTKPDEPADTGDDAGDGGTGETDHEGAPTDGTPAADSWARRVFGRW